LLFIRRQPPLDQGTARAIQALLGQVQFMKSEERYLGGVLLAGAFLFGYALFAIGVPERVTQQPQAFLSAVDCATTSAGSGQGR
jgi:hypothetical protein